MAPAIGLAALAWLRALAAAGPVLLAVDDLHCLDQASAGVLRFLARRVDDTPVWMAATERVAKNRTPAGRALCPPPLLLIGLDSAPAADTDRRWLAR